AVFHADRSLESCTGPREAARAELALVPSLLHLLAVPLAAHDPRLAVASGWHRQGWSGEDAVDVDEDVERRERQLGRPGRADEHDLVALLAEGEGARVHGAETDEDEGVALLLHHRVEVSLDGAVAATGANLDALPHHEVLRPLARVVEN